MKESFILLGTFAIVALSFASCNRAEIEDPLDRSLNHTVTINASFDVTTKTAISEGDVASFVWSSDDAKRFLFKENDVKGTDVALNITNSNRTAKISATFETVPADEYTYSAFLAATRTSGDNPKIPATQNPTTSSYDPDADILVAKSLTFDETQDELSLQFARPVVISKMTLEGLTVGESISTVGIKGDKDIIGNFNISSQSWNGQGDEITVNVNQTVPSDGKIVVYFISMPVDDVTLTVTATSANYTFSKTFKKTISFIENQVTVFGVSGLNSVAKEDYSGSYVLGNATGTAVALKYASGNNIPAAATTMKNGVIYYDPDVVDLSTAQITLALVSEGDFKGMYTLYQNGKYLYAAGADSNNYLKASTNISEATPENYYWEVSYTDDKWSIKATKSSNNNVLQNNGLLFSCYGAANHTAVALFKEDVFKPIPVITVTDAISIEAGAVSREDTGASFNSNTSSVEAYAFDDDLLTQTSEWLSVSVSGTGSDAKVLFSATENTTNAERVAYIEIYAENADERYVNAYITVTQNYPGGASALLSLDVTNKEFGTSVYNTSTAYGDWVIVNGANNNKGWNYFKMGGKSSTLESSNPCYIYSTKAISQKAGSVTVHLPAGSLSKNGMAVNSWGLYVYSDSSMSTQIDYVSGGTITNNEGTFEFSPSTGKEWASGSYFKVCWDLANTTSTNGIVCVDKITVYSEGN